MKAIGQLRSGEMSERTLGILLVLPTAVLLIVLIGIPVIITIHASFYNVNTATREYRFVGLRNYRWLLTGDLFLPSLWRTALWTGSNVVVQVLLAVVIALVLNAKLRGRWLARGIALFPYVVPAVVVALTWRFALNDAIGIISYIINQVLMKVGLVSRPIIWLGNTDTALWVTVAVNIWKYTPWMMVLFLARLQVIPLELYDAAQVDGANTWQMFWYVTLPWLWPVILIATLIRTVWVSTEFDLIYLLAYGGPLQATTTLPVLIRKIAIDHGDSGKASAVALTLAGLLMVVALLYLRVYRRASAKLE